MINKYFGVGWILMFLLILISKGCKYNVVFVLYGGMKVLFVFIICLIVLMNIFLGIIGISKCLVF